MSPVTVEVLSAANRRDWDAYVAACPAATFFHQAGWLEAVQATYGHPARGLLARRAGATVGVLPLSEVRSWLGGHALVSTPFAVEGGIAADDADVAAALADAAARLGRERRADHLELRGPADGSPGWVARRDRYAAFRRPIQSDDEANLKAIPRKKRADVRKGMGGALSVEVTTDLRDFHRIYAASVHRLGTPVFPRRWFEALCRTFPDATEVSLVHGPDGPVAALLSLFWRDTVLPYYGGALDAARPLHAYDHMYWSLMQRAARRGLTCFDFGRSKVGTGAYDYKTYWGFEPQPLAYHLQPLSGKKLPDVNPLNPRYSRFVEIWKRLPASVANTAGPVLARHLG